jgi:hypothetical protein
MKKCEVVDETHVSCSDRGFQTVFLGGEVQGVKSLDLGERDGRYPWSTRLGGAPSQEISSEVENDLAVLVEEKGAVLIS